MVVSFLLEWKTRVEKKFLLSSELALTSLRKACRVGPNDEPQSDDVMKFHDKAIKSTNTKKTLGHEAEVPSCANEEKNKYKLKMDLTEDARRRCKKI